MNDDLRERLSQLFLEVDDLLSDVTNLVKDASIEVLNFKAASALPVEAYTDAKRRQSALERLYIQLTITKEEYEEYYNSTTKVSN